MALSVKSLVKKTIPLALGVFLIWISLSKLTPEDIESVKTSFKTANYWWVLLSLVLGVLSHFSRAYRWKFMLEPLGYKPKFLNSAMAVIIAYLVNLGIPRAGELSRAAALAEYEDVPFEKGFGTIVAERVADLVMYALFILLAFFAQYDLIKTELSKKLPENPVYTVVALIILAAIGYLFLKWLKNSEKESVVKLKTFISGLIVGVKSIFTMKKKWAFIFHTLFIWVMYIMMLYVAKFAIPETADLSINAVLISFVIGTFSYAATNGGIGAYPIAIQSALLLYGINEVAGLSFGWIMWTSQTLMVLVFGGLSFLLLPLYNKSKKISA
ncbi:lysylphosphatidylglycerol synthase transmembrane domain-containing protein [Flavicella sp.]|uniref:lysylphosphatidylglycerol synthase transmembrane domain-containing protein n=1 Tax=Flavicella sp. TaxID=2957742 RepID=UPI002629E1D4|nr:lysylphosphatidylglycerol synthase transmembrane domain-containing protein [Flavicella sp.]MDG1805223.1 lysylphosphatidylglycerol synthase transmembrane domain-containing protein [Flavicella sp.]